MAPAARRPRAAVRAALVASSKKPKDEFPQLAPLGLRIEKTKGRGNCLFHAASMQMYGTDQRHAAIRAQTVEFIEENPDYFKGFIQVKEGGGTRGSSRRGAQIMTEDLSANAHDKAWANYLKEMRKGGTYADHLEITAIAGRFGYTVEVFNHEKKTMNKVLWCEKEGRKGVMRIAHHQYNHFSSVVKIGKEHDSDAAKTPEIESQGDQSSVAGGRLPYLRIYSGPNKFPSHVIRVIPRARRRSLRV